MAILYVLNTGKYRHIFAGIAHISVSVLGVPNTGIPVSVYAGLETLLVGSKGLKGSNQIKCNVRSVALLGPVFLQKCRNVLDTIKGVFFVLRNNEKFQKIRKIPFLVYFCQF
jgi:hypothetical protein